MRNRRGITLIALIITIIVLLILAGVSIATFMKDGRILKIKEELEFKTLGGKCLDEVKIYVFNMLITNKNEVINTNDNFPITEILPDIPDEYKDRFVIINNELYYTYNSDDEKQQIKEKQW